MPRLSRFESTDLADDGLKVFPDSGTEIAVGQVFHGGHRLAARFVLPLWPYTEVAFDRIEPTQDLGLHHQDGFQHIFSFGHVVTPLGCVETPNVPGGGMAFYSYGGG